MEYGMLGGSFPDWGPCIKTNPTPLRLIVLLFSIYILWYFLFLCSPDARSLGYILFTFIHYRRLDLLSAECRAQGAASSFLTLAAVQSTLHVHLTPSPISTFWKGRLYKLNRRPTRRRRKKKDAGARDRIGYWIRIRGSCVRQDHMQNNCPTCD